ncbi:PilZ domain-containing protein [Oceanidesulfovibrio marinus]|uniref:PilZ domain-containing protein n=1 Tax=Oceanidesulfovibrio marinus TaxID=370038 RepID=A0A6P1ZBG1_9BACT|nr:PilZ domain-containing protein [Oceanidesulfovibrio marinus]QJT11035.1 hypothetical protein E8L03_19890 [Oceanidesulfovibrio marinus]TVM31348.1 hypothetical protein DQK91_18285 [Oceanidesulfovibrio marinus]
MLLQCPVCDAQTSVPRQLEGTGLECPSCGAKGYAGRRPGKSDSLNPFIDRDPLEDTALGEFLDTIAEELARGGESGELLDGLEHKMEFYDLPGQLPYEEMLYEETRASVKTPAEPSGFRGEHSGSAREYGEEEKAADEELRTASFMCACGFTVEVAERFRGKRGCCPRCGEYAVVGELPGDDTAVEALRQSREHRQAEAGPEPMTQSRRGRTAPLASPLPRVDFSKYRKYPRVEAMGLTAELDGGAVRAVVGNFSVSGLGLEPCDDGSLQPGMNVYVRLVAKGSGPGVPPAELLKGLGVLQARVVRVDVGGVGLAFENLSSPVRRKLAALVARLARCCNEARICSMQEAQGF